MDGSPGIARRVNSNWDGRREGADLLISPYPKFIGWGHVGLYREGRMDSLGQKCLLCPEVFDITGDNTRSTLDCASPAPDQSDGVSKQTSLALVNAHAQRFLK